MKLPRVYVGEDNQSHFEELDLPMVRERRAVSVWLEGARVAFVESPAMEAQDWHHAPRRQIVLVLNGALEIEIGDGSTRRFGAGEFFLADDLGGQGHRTRDVEGPIRLLWVELPEDLDLEQWRP